MFLKKGVTGVTKGLFSIQLKYNVLYLSDRNHAEVAHVAPFTVAMAPLIKTCSGHVSNKIYIE